MEGATPARERDVQLVGREVDPLLYMTLQTTYMSNVKRDSPLLTVYSLELNIVLAMWTGD